MGALGVWTKIGAVLGLHLGRTLLVNLSSAEGVISEDPVTELSLVALIIDELLFRGLLNKVFLYMYPDFKKINKLLKRIFSDSQTVGRVGTHFSQLLGQVLEGLKEDPFKGFQIFFMKVFEIWFGFWYILFYAMIVYEFLRRAWNSIKLVYAKALVPLHLENSNN